MQYNTVGDSGKDYTIRVCRDVHYIILTVLCEGEEIYRNDYLPVCRTCIEAEENAERIVRQYIK